MSEHGVDPLVIAEILGHSGLGTVQTHIEITSGRQRDAYSAVGDITRGSPPDPECLPEGVDLDREIHVLPGPISAHNLERKPFGGGHATAVCQ